MTVPAGFERVRAGGAVALTRPSARDWVEATLGGGATLYDAARELSQGTMEGRGVVHVVAATAGEDKRWAVRRYMRGGWSRWLGDRYVRGGTPRPLQELAASMAALQRGVPTPSIICAAVYSRGIFYRGDLVTEYISNSRDLASMLFGVSSEARRESSSHRIAAVTAAGDLIRQMALARVLHPDVNAKNILIHGDPEAPHAMLLDLDRCVISKVPAGISTAPVYRRLERSFLKWEGRTGLRMSEEERRALRADPETPR